MEPEAVASIPISIPSSSFENNTINTDEFLTLRIPLSVTGFFRAFNSFFSEITFYCFTFWTSLLLNSFLDPMDGDGGILELSSLEYDLLPEVDSLSWGGALGSFRELYGVSVVLLILHMFISFVTEELPRQFAEFIWILTMNEDNSSSILKQNPQQTLEQEDYWDVLFTAMTGIVPPPSIQKLELETDRQADITDLSPLDITLVLTPILLGTFLILTLLMFIFAHISLHALLSSLPSMDDLEGESIIDTGQIEIPAQDTNENNLEREMIYGNDQQQINITREESRTGDMVDDFSASPVITCAINILLMLESVLPWVNFIAGTYVCLAVGGWFSTLLSIFSTLLVFLCLKFWGAWSIAVSVERG